MMGIFAEQIRKKLKMGLESKQMAAISSANKNGLFVSGSFNAISREGQYLK